MTNKDKVLKLARQQTLTPSQVATDLKVSRAYASQLLKELTDSGKLRSAVGYYFPPTPYVQIAIPLFLNVVQDPNYPVEKREKLLAGLRKFVTFLEEELGEDLFNE